MHGANGDANLGHHVGRLRNDPFPMELFAGIQGRCSPCVPRRAALDEPRLVRVILRPRGDLAYQPKNAHATSANATVMAAATNQISVLRATRLRVGLNPMLFSIAVNATIEAHTR